MKNITHTDSCTIGSAVDDVKVSVTFRGAHTGVFEVEQKGVPMPPNADGTISVGKANTLGDYVKLVGTAVGVSGGTGSVANILSAVRS